MGTERAQLIVGRALCGALRRRLEMMQFHDRTLTWTEGKGWLDRVFTVEGSSASISDLERMVNSLE